MGTKRFYEVTRLMQYLHFTLSIYGPEFDDWFGASINWDGIEFNVICTHYSLSKLNHISYYVLPTRCCHHSMKNQT